MPIISDYDNFNTFSFLDDDGSRVVPGDLPPDEGPAPDPGSPLDNPNLRSYWWDRFTDITNSDPLGPVGRPMTDDEIAAQWAYYGGNPLDLPLQNLSNQFRTAYESEQMYNRWLADMEMANRVQGHADEINAMAADITDPQARAEFIAKMQQYIDSRLTDQQSYDAAKAIFDNTAKTTDGGAVTAPTGTDRADFSIGADGAVRVDAFVTSANNANGTISTNASGVYNDFYNRLTDSRLNGPNTGDGNVNFGATSGVGGTPQPPQTGSVPVDLSERGDLNRNLGTNLTPFEYVLFVVFKHAFKSLNLSDLDLIDKAKSAALQGTYFMLDKSGNPIADINTFLTREEAAGRANMGSVVFNIEAVKELFNAASRSALDIGNAGTVTVTDTFQNQTPLQSSGGAIGTNVTPRPLLTMSAVGGGLTLATLAVPAANALMTSTASELAAAGAISNTLMGIVSALPPVALGLTTMGVQIAFLSDAIIGQAQIVAKNDAEKLQLANEIASLMIEVARKAQLQEAAAIRLAQITSIYNSQNRPLDWADPTTNPFDDTFGIPDYGEIATTGGTGLQPSSPETPGLPPNIDPAGLAAKILAFVTAAVGSITLTDYLQSDAVQTANQVKAARESLTDPNAVKIFDERLKQIMSEDGLSEEANLERMRKYLESAKTWGNGNLQDGLVRDYIQYTLHRNLNLPYGMESRIELQRFGVEVRTGLRNAGITDAQSYLQGSAITGIKFTTGEIFDIGRTSDWDMAVASSSLFARAQAIGVGIRGGGSRTAPLTENQLRALGLYELQQRLSTIAGRDVNIMIFTDQQTVKNRNPLSIYVP